MRLPAALGLLILYVCPVPAHAAAQTSSCNHAVAAARTFLLDFENLDWDRFRRSFADNATVFFPPPGPPHRFSGRAEFEPQFKKVFAGIRAVSRSDKPPYHHLPPVGLQCDPLSDDAAVISFTLENSDRIGRRTIVWQRFGSRWLITHLHASNMAR